MWPVNVCMCFNVMGYSSYVSSHSMQLRVIMPPLQAPLTEFKLDVATQLRWSHGSGQINTPLATFSCWYHTDVVKTFPRCHLQAMVNAVEVWREESRQWLDFSFCIRDIYKHSYSHLPPSPHPSSCNLWWQLQTSLVGISKMNVVIGFGPMWPRKPPEWLEGTVCQYNVHRQGLAWETGCLVKNVWINLTATIVA